MNLSYYKHCMVPGCKSTSVKTPNKLFIYVTRNLRQTWLKLAGRRDAHSLSTISRMHFCEDHFDLPNDMLNYNEYRIMGKVAQVRMRPGCIPSKFESEDDKTTLICDSIEQQDILKKQRMEIIAECLKEAETNCPQSTICEDHCYTTSEVIKDEAHFIFPSTANKSVQVSRTHKFRSKATQTPIKTVDRATSPFKPTTSSSTTPFEIVTVKRLRPAVKRSRPTVKRPRPTVQRPRPTVKKPRPTVKKPRPTVLKPRPTLSSLSNVTETIFIKEEQSDSDTSLCTPSIAIYSHSP